MTRLIDVLTDEERAVKVRISVLEEKEKELVSRICLQKRILERELQKPKKDKAYHLGGARSN